MVPDYEGPESQYGPGRQAAHAVLDSIRAAHQFEPADLGRKKTKVGLVGYSGGGLASAWATELAPSYAPRLPIAGTAAGGVPPDIEAVARNINGGPYAGILFGAAQGIERAYPEIGVRRLLTDEGKAFYDSISDSCVNDIISAGAFKSIEDLSRVDDPLSLPRVQKVLAKNHLGRKTPKTPIYMYHAVNDNLIPIKEVDELAAEYCEEGVALKYYRDPASEHLALSASGAPAAIQYLADRFAGLEPPTTC